MSILTFTSNKLKNTSMASKFLTRFTTHFITLTPKQTLKIPISKPFNFSTISKLSPQIPVSPKPTNQTHIIINPKSPAQTFVTELVSSQPQLKNLRDFDSQELEKCLGILFQLKLPRNDIVSMICNCPGVLEFDFLRKWELGFKNLGVFCESIGMIRNVLEHSRRFGIDPLEFSKCVKVLKGVGFSDGTVVRVLEEFPRVVMIDEREIRRGIEFLGGIGIGKLGIDRVYSSIPWTLGFRVEHRLKPLFDEFVKLRFNENVIRREIVRDPRILTMELGEISRCVEFLQTLKCRVPIMEKIYSHGVFRAGLEVKLRVDCLCRHRLTRKDAFSILWREPRAITYEVPDIENKIDFLLNKMKYEIEWLVKVPEYLGVSFEKKIVPRFNVIEYLRSKGGLLDKVGLNDLIKPSRLRFYNFYVKPYPECEEIFGSFSREFEAKKRCPVGLWKMFKPEQFPMSKKDAENIKSFMG